MQVMPPVLDDSVQNETPRQTPVLLTCMQSQNAYLCRPRMSQVPTRVSEARVDLTTCSVLTNHASHLRHSTNAARRRLWALEHAFAAFVAGCLGSEAWW